MGRHVDMNPESCISLAMGRRWLTILLSLLVMLVLAAGVRYISAVTHVFGLGYSYVEIHERSIGVDARLWVLATPVDGTLIDMVLVAQIRELNKPKRPIVGMRFLPPRLRTRLMNEFILSVQKRDVMQDVAIWSRSHERVHRYRSGTSCRMWRSGVGNDIGPARDCVGPTARSDCIGATASSSIRIARTGVRMARWLSWQREPEIGHAFRILTGRSRRVEGDSK